jgi:hypothetical protein
MKLQTLPLSLASGLLASGLSFLLLSGCAQRAKPVPDQSQLDRAADYEELVINSQPMGADVSLSSGERCLTPCRVSVRKDSILQVTVSKKGYREQSVEVINNLEALRRFNEKRGNSTAGLRVNTLRLAPNPVNVTLKRR